MAVTGIIQERMGLRREEYRGAETAAVYSESGQEFAALVGNAGVYDLNWRAKLLVTGKDRVRWLNGMISNNVRDLSVGQGIYSFLLTHQGRILGDLYTYNRGEFLVIDTDQSEVESLTTTLRRYIIMDKVEIANVADKLASIGIAGPKAREVLSKVLELPELKPLQVVDATWKEVGLTLVRSDLPQIEAYEIWTDPENLNQFWQELVSAGATPAGSNAVELLRIGCGVPLYGQDIRERDLPQETEQTRALSFIKGCYIGQEIVERIRSRGAVHRKFTGFRIDGPLPVPGTKAQLQGKEVAEITSSATLPKGDHEIGVALGYVRREVIEAGKPIEIGGARATVVDVPFHEVL